MVQLIFGGSGSGKSAFAEQKILELDADKRFYVATMKIYGDEEKQKVLRHQKMRSEKGFVTIEQPVNINEVVEKINWVGACSKSSVLLECLSNLVANEMFLENGEIVSEETVFEKIKNDIGIVAACCENLVIVSNNIFEDGIDYDKASKAYMKCLGRLNCYLANIADKVFELVVGIVQELK